MKSILISIKPEWVAKILNGNKTIEIRKTFPKCELPIDVYIYCTKDKDNLLDVGYDDFFSPRFIVRKDHKNCAMNGKVVAKFTLNKVEEIRYFDDLEIPEGYEDYDGNWVDTSTHAKDTHWISNGMLKQSCLSYDEVHKYLGKKTGYAWHISNLEIFNKSRELSEFNALQRAKATDCGYLKQCKNCGKRFNRCHLLKPLTKAPQSWCYVEVLL